jgi:hypothetical protein
VLVAAQPHPGDPHEHTLTAGMGKNGGMTARDGPTFLSTIGWDWVPAVRDRDTGIWQKVYLSASGPVLLKDPLVTTDLPLPKIDSADVAVETTVENVTDQPISGVVKGSIESIAFEQPVTIAAHSTQMVRFDPATTPALHIANPRLWWPNGYGKQEMYTLHLAFEQRGVAQKSAVSDAQDVPFGVRKITYAVPDSDNLTISVNGVRVFIRGGDWGLDEAMKRIPRERLEAQIHLHALANMNMIRNWVGQSTSEDFYEMCDKYGILLWDEFFQANPSDGPNPDDLCGECAGEDRALPQPSLDRRVVRAQRGLSAEGDQRCAAGVAEGAGADAAVSAELDRGARGKVGRPVPLARAGGLLPRGCAVQDGDRQRVGADGGIDPRDDAGEGLGDDHGRLG